jgi:Xaa-Pro dipeptidase
VAKDGIDTLYREHIETLMLRTASALAETGFDALVIHSGAAPIQFLDDQDYPFKVNPHFKAWVPVLDNPRSALVIVPHSRPKLLFYQPVDFWHKAADLPREAWVESVDIVPIRDRKELAGQLAGLGRVAVVAPPEGLEDFPADRVNPADLLGRLHFDRAVKTRYELECLRRATVLGVRGHLAALAAFRAGESEYVAHMRYLEACDLREAELPYNNIIAYNEHAAILHYQHLDRATPAPLRSLLIDAGAQFRGYASDITRTYAAGRGRFDDLIAALDEAQLLLCDEITVGRDYREVHLTAHRLVADVLQRTGVTTLGGQAAVENGLTSVFFPHGIGHLLGLQVHDVGGVMADADGHEVKRPKGHPYLRMTRTLQPGVVVTVEPGIYFIDSLLEAARSDERGQYIDWNAVQALHPFGGVRIEDNVVTTASKPLNLTREAFAAASKVREVRRA